MIKQTDEQKIRFWHEHMAAWKKSNLSKTQYCAEKGINRKSLGFWQRKLESEEQKSTLKSSPFVAANVRNLSENYCTLILPNQVKLSLPIHWWQQEGPRLLQWIEQA